MRFIFWNIHKAAIHDRVAQLVIDRDIDVVVLAEARDQIPHISSSLSSLSKTSFYTFDSIGCERINIIAKFPPNMASICYETPNFTILHFSLPGLDSFLLVAVHLPSKIWSNPMDQAGHCEDLAEIIVEEENRIGHTRTMLLGDINQNPFEEGVISAKGLHAVMSINIAKKETRKFYKKKYRFFYNPMWSILGDTTGRVPGTFFYETGHKCEFFWHMFDQVLIRPSLFHRFQQQSLKIITGDSKGSFLDIKGRPDKKTFQTIFLSFLK